MSDQQHPDPAASPTLTRLIPDLDDELVAALWRIEELLLTLATRAEDDPDDVGLLAPPLGGRLALDALHRLQDELTPTRSRTHPSAAELPRLFGPDGCFEHRPLRLGQGRAARPRDPRGRRRPSWDTRSPPHPNSPTRSRPAPKPPTRPASRTPSTDVELVETFARINGLLDLATTTDTEMLSRRQWTNRCGDLVAHRRRRDRALSLRAKGRTARGPTATCWINAD